MPYIELHASSAFSFLRGGSSPEHLAETAAKLKMPALALLDRNGVYGSQRFSAACREQNVRPIVGCELAMEDGCMLPVLVEDRIGYKNLCELLTQAHLRSEKGSCVICYSELAAFSAGLVALFGNPSAKRAQFLNETFGRENVYIEIQRHLIRGEEQINRQLIDLADSYHLPLLATNGVRYATAHGRQVLDVFTCIREHTHLDPISR